MANKPSKNAPKPEMKSEISAIIDAIAKAFNIPEADAIDAVERSLIKMEFGQEKNGDRFVAATLGERTVRIYQGAIKVPKPGDNIED